MNRRRILFIAEFWPGATGNGLAQAMRKLGHEVAELDIRDWLGAKTLIGRVMQRVFSNQFFDRYNRAILKRARDLQPAVCIVLKGSFISPQTIRTLQDSGVFCVNFYPDVSFAHPGLTETALCAYDLFATTKSFHLGWLGARLPEDRIGFVHHGYVDQIHMPIDTPETEAEFDWDICYIGNHSAYKQAWMEAVCAAFPDLRIAIAGHRWLGIDAPKLSNAALLPPHSNHDFSRLASRSRVNLAFHFGIASSDGWEDNVSTRSFELPACRAFMLHIDNDEVRGLYDVGREIDVFADAQQLVERISFYLEHPEQRHAMADAAYHRAVPAYSLSSRAAELMGLIEARLSRQPVAG
jgi:spore maturation protein CgeB